MGRMVSFKEPQIKRRQTCGTAIFAGIPSMAQ